MKCKSILSLSLLITISLSIFSAQIEANASEILEPSEKYEEVSPANITRIWIQQETVYFANGSPPPTYYYSKNRFAGYLELFGHADADFFGQNGGTYGYYRGYVYSSSNIPIPTKVPVATN